MSGANWKSYEEVAVYLLNQFADTFGLERVEGKQQIAGSVTPWNIEGKGFLQDGAGFVIVECRRYTNSRQNQEKMGALAYRIIDTGASGGIVVSPLGLQEGAARIAKAENIHSVLLDPSSTSSEFILRFLNQTFIGLRAGTITPTDSLQVGVRDKDGNVTWIGSS